MTKIIITIAIIAFIYNLVWIGRNQFRKNVKKGDIVGIDFGLGIVENRKVHLVTTHGVMVENFKGELKEYPFSRVYVPSREGFVAKDDTKGK